MRRRPFIKKISRAAAVSLIPSFPGKRKSHYSDEFPELARHKISHCDLVEVDYSWPRFVGKNGRIGFHGQEKKCTVLKVHTDQGAMGWGLSSSAAGIVFPQLVGKSVSEVISPGVGIGRDLDRIVDFALHDLMGVILEKPVHEILGSAGQKENPVYSGMIYLDELNPGNEVKGIDAILESCDWDFNYGYRQLKIKIGRSGRWYNHDEGLKKDIEVVKAIHNHFQDRSMEILVDANDQYDLKDTITFLDGIGEVPLFWVEEPFREEIEDGRKLRNWMDDNGFSDTYYADGEALPLKERCFEMGREGILDIYLDDIYGLGFTAWTVLAQELKAINMLASPHGWGNMLKTHYIAHYAAAFGGVPTMEGVTCFSEDIDYGEYPIIDGKKRVSDAPGFGMKLLR